MWQRFCRVIFTRDQPCVRRQCLNSYTYLYSFRIIFRPAKYTLFHLYTVSYITFNPFSVKDELTRFELWKWQNKKHCQNYGTSRSFWAKWIGASCMFNFEPRGRNAAARFGIFSAMFWSILDIVWHCTTERVKVSFMGSEKC